MMEVGSTAKQRRLCSLPQLSLVLFLSLSLQLPARGSYLLVADFHTYNNSLHSFVNTSASPFTTHCCDGRDAPDCTDPCNTVLNYCFKEVGAVNSFANDSTVLRGCMTGGGSLTELVERTDNIDFSKPPLSVSGAPTRRSLSNRGPLWPGGIQFFVRSVSDGEIVDYLSTNVYLNPGENLTNRILTGDHFEGERHIHCQFLSHLHLWLLWGELQPLLLAWEQ
ncbi:hypothetical protein GBAR_LOCUS19394 [Geodia barretti]|uniref:Uncharacterized protein n=1 Tax=Geodia barretti TaxID=519541 RepID=A0AA35WUN1_GEOBA|nr:hypothetical protein GBAR_LOCUS19394 [Geodia barretti]